MKILTAEQIREIDAMTIQREGISSLELMDRAATSFYNFFVTRCSEKVRKILVVAGSGNNGGDALVVARMLYQSGYEVMVCMVGQEGGCSADCAHNFGELKKEGIPWQIIDSEQKIPRMAEFDLIIDGIFGTGLSRKVEGIAALVIEQMNQSGLEIYSIDVPSGLFLDRKTDFAVRASATVTFQIPKLALFLPSNSDYVGEVQIVDIGLDAAAIYAAETEMEFTEKVDIKDLLKPLSLFAHKGTLGHALLVGGSLGKCGAVCLAAKAALRSGCGLVTAYLPRCGTQVIQSAVPEVMALEDLHNEYITGFTWNLQPDAIGLGPGMGQHKDTEEAFGDFLSRYHGPLVVDADGLNILARNPDWYSRLSSGTILTPHPGELVRLIGEWRDDFDKIEKVRRFAGSYDLVILIKGAYSLVIDKSRVYVNSSGTPALATAGSGDVLTGIITSLLAQGYRPIDAARVGVYLHGATADITRNTIHPRSFMASDIIDQIGKTYQFVEKMG